MATDLSEPPKIDQKVNPEAVIAIFEESKQSET